MNNVSKLVAQTNLIIGIIKGIWDVFLLIIVYSNRIWV